MNRLVPAALIVLFCGSALGAGFGELRDDVELYPDEPPPEGFKLNMRLAEPSLPAPPEQAAPWKPPATKFSNRFIEAVATLFRQGLADPRGCQYREIQVLTGATPPHWANQLVSTHGWILPGRKKESQQLAVCWNGLVYPVVSVGKPTALRAE